MLDAAASSGRLVARVAPVLPVEKLVLGKPVEEAADLLPRLFALCRSAQGSAARRALGLPPPEDETQTLTEEVTRDHLMKLCLHWPAKVGGAAPRLPARWREGVGIMDAIFGRFSAPSSPEDFERFLCSGLGVAPVLRGIETLFGAGICASGPLPALTQERAFAPSAVENSVAGRQSGHPVMRHIEATRGRGPFWRAVARAFDLSDAVRSQLPSPQVPASGKVIVAAARGAYAVSAQVDEGKVVSFKRVTPTDHMLAPGGILEQSLRTLPADREALAPLLLDILDPCSPLRLVTREMANA